MLELIAHKDADGHQTNLKEEERVTANWEERRQLAFTPNWYPVSHQLVMNSHV